MDKKQISWVIYGLRVIGTTEYRYVGKTIKRVSDRFGNHREDARKYVRPRHVLNWMNAEGVDNIEAKILEACPVGEKEYLDYAEKYWISSLLLLGHRLTNHTTGGDGTSGYHWSEESKRNQSLRMKGKFAGEKNPRYGIKGEAHPMYGVKGAAHPGFGYKAPPERIEAMRVFATGRTHSEETKRKLSEAHRGKPKSEETKLKIKQASHNYHHVRRDILNPSCVFCNPTTDK